MDLRARRPALLEHGAPQLVRALRWLFSFLAYFALLTDQDPLDESALVRFEVHAEGAPTVRSALLRLLYSLPAAIMFAVLSLIASVAWLLAALEVLVSGRYASWLWDFQLRVLRFQASLFASHASLTPHGPIWSSGWSPPSEHQPTGAR